MGFIDLFCVASMPVLKVLLVTALGSFLAFDAIDILGENTRTNVNRLAFFVFNPAMVGSNLAKTITLESVIKLWFMPLNILITFIVGSALGWVVSNITRAPKHLQGLILGSCAAGNLGNLPIIIIPTICREKGSPFGDPDVCHTHGLAYASLSMAIGAIFLWTIVYNIVRVSSKNADEQGDTNKSCSTTPKDISIICERSQGDGTEPLLAPEDCSSVESALQLAIPNYTSDGRVQIPALVKLKQQLSLFQKMFNLKSLFVPSTTGALVGFIIGTVPHMRQLMIGSAAPLRVIQDSAALLGDAAIPTVTLIVGGNLLKGLKGLGVRLSIILGIIIVRYIVLPLVGITIVKGAIHFGLVTQSDRLYQFVLLLQYALPPAMNIGTITQLFGAGQSECSVILLWTYALASIALTLWSTFFMWLVAST